MELRRNFSEPLPMRDQKELCKSKSFGTVSKAIVFFEFDWKGALSERLLMVPPKFGDYSYDQFK
jgi:hypothetical protein